MWRSRARACRRTRCGSGANEAHGDGGLPRDIAHAALSAGGKTAQQATSVRIRCPAPRRVDAAPFEPP